MKAKVDLTEFRKTGEYTHRIGACTPGFWQLPFDVQLAFTRAFMRAPKGDHHYTLQFGETKVYACENGQTGYTIMLPEEY